jgi:hypothetical protein
MNTRLLNDNTRAGVLAGINKVAPQSPLIQNPTVASSLASLTAKGATLSADVAAVAQNEKLFKASVGARDLSRAAFDAELDTLRTLVENNSKSAGDVTSMGFTVFVPAATSQAPPDPPAALIVKIGNAHGKARVAVAGSGYQGKFAAEVSTDPTGAGPWSPLPGNGKERKLSGYPSGTKLWVRFAAVRFGMQSAWSVAVLVTIP